MLKFAKMLTFVVLFCSIVAIRSEQLHDHMTDEEIQSVFHVPRDQVPEYDVVPIRSSFRRNNEGADRITMETSDEHIDVYLEPTDGFLIGENTPVYLSKPNNNYVSGVEYVPVKNAFKNIMLYQNPGDRLALAVEELADGYNIFGMINDLMIRPIPRRLTATPAGLLGLLFGLPRNQILRFGTSSGNDTIYDIHHIVYRSASLAVNPPRDLKTSDRKPRPPAPAGASEVPPVIFPEILVVMDNSLFKSQKEDVNSAILYLISFWNAVDLRYRSMKNPEIRLNIAGLIISVEEGGAPYIDTHKLNSTADDLTQVDADKALVGMSEYFYGETDLPNHDATMAMTRLDLCNMVQSEFFEGICDSTTMGYAYEAGACNRSSVDQITEAVGLVEDNGGYSGIIPAAHELAHLFGVPHDEDECADGGYIMATELKHSENSFLWSECSKKAFRDFFSSEDGTCLFSKPITDRKGQRILPGTVQSLDQQCEKIYGEGVTKACQEANPCVLLQCQVPDQPYCRGIAAAAEGSTCAPGKRCISGYCVSLRI